MDIITIDGMVEHDFRLSIEDMLRLDQVDEALERLGGLIEPFSGPNGVLPPCFREAARRRVEIGGWSRLGERLGDHDRKDHPITAIGVTLADATKLGGPGPSRGRLAPFVKTFYFSDEAYPFSASSRDDLLDGYSRDGFEWQGDYQATDATLSVRGLDDLYGPIVMLENRLLASDEPDVEEIRAGTIGACLVAVLIHRALRDTVRRDGLPRPLCVIAACDGVYPHFDAPVVGIGDGEDDGAATASADEDFDESKVAAEGSLLNLITRQNVKAMALTIGAQDAEDAARFGEAAAAHRLDGPNDHFVAGAVDLSLPLERADSSWDDAEARARNTEPIAEPSQAWWSEEILGGRPNAQRQAFDPTYEPPQPPAVRFRTWEEIAEAEAPQAAPENACESEPLPPPSSHGLRAQMIATRAEAPATPRRWRILSWLRGRVRLG